MVCVVIQVSGTNSAGPNVSNNNIDAFLSLRNQAICAEEWKSRLILVSTQQ